MTIEIFLRVLLIINNGQESHINEHNVLQMKDIAWRR